MFRHTYRHLTPPFNTIQLIPINFHPNWSLLREIGFLSDRCTQPTNVQSAQCYSKVPKIEAKRMWRISLRRQHLRVVRLIETHITSS